MERKSPLNSILESKLFKIPIEEYEDDINSVSAKGKKNEILDLLNNYNKLRSEEEYEDIKDKLHKSCRKGDIDLIKIYLSETIEHSSKLFQFKIDKTNRTASLFKIKYNTQEVEIPRTFEHESVEYLITSITGTCYGLSKMIFVDDSAVKTIYRDVFSNSRIYELNFPESLKELKEGWNYEIRNLTKISISPLNDQFKFIDNKYLVGKSDSNKDEFDILLYVNRRIEEFSIPSNIKIISSYAFDLCFKLFKIEIPDNSNLQIIGSNAFSYSDVEEIYFPAKLKELKEGWCWYANNLTKITISPLNDQFKFIDNKYLVGKSDLNKDEFDILLFASRDINEISIPSNIKIISSYAFYRCKNLTKVKISRNSNLQTIEKYAFSDSSIEKIYIPSTVSKICEEAFQCCNNLTKVKISTNSNLQIIEKLAFSFSNIEKIFLPAKLKELNKEWCGYTDKLTKITISPLNDQFKFIDNKYLVGKSDSNKDEFDILLFVSRDIKEISIPSNIKIISPYAFFRCKNLREIKIPKNSNLQTIEKYAFSDSNIEKIYIPSTVSKIGEFAFHCCKKLTRINIPTNSNLQIIKRNAFSCSNINEFFFPSKVSTMSKNVFFYCSNLQIIEISEDSKLESLPLSCFDNCHKLMIMMPSSLEKLINKNSPI